MGKQTERQDPDPDPGKTLRALPRTLNPKADLADVEAAKGSEKEEGGIGAGPVAKMAADRAPPRVLHVARLHTQHAPHTSFTYQVLPTFAKKCCMGSMGT